MSDHIFETTLPLDYIKVCISKPGISISVRTAPLALAHVVIEVNIDLLLETLCSDSIIDLWNIDVSLKSFWCYWKIYLQSRGMW